MLYNKLSSCSRFSLFIYNAKILRKRIRVKLEFWSHPLFSIEFFIYLFNNRIFASQDRRKTDNGHEKITVFYKKTPALHDYNRAFWQRVIFPGVILSPAYFERTMQNGKKSRISEKFLLVRALVRIFMCLHLILFLQQLNNTWLPKIAKQPIWVIYLSLWLKENMFDCVNQSLTI